MSDNDDNDNWRDVNTLWFQGDRKPKTEEEIANELAAEPSASDRALEYEEQQAAQNSTTGQQSNFKIHSLSWRHTEDSRKGENKAREGDTIRLLCSVDGYSDGTNVTFELLWKDKNGSETQLANTSATLQNGVAAVNIKLDFTNITEKKFTIYFTPSAQGRYGSNCDIPLEITETVPVQLFEYPSISSATDLRGKNGIESSFFKKLQDGQNDISIMYKQKPVLVNDKWVYIFKKQKGATSLSYEVKPTLNGETQEYEYVSWKKENLENNQNNFPRQTETEKLEGLNLKAGVEYYFLISQEQLPLHRIDFYNQNSDKLAMRAAHAKIQSIANNEAFQINLVDYIGVCFALVEEKNKAVSKYNEYFGNEDESTKRYLANMVTAIETNRPAIKKWLDFDAVVSYKNREEIRTNRLINAKENCTGRLKDWKLSEGYKFARDDYNGTEELEKKIIEIEAQVTAEDEVEYLSTIGKDENSWYNKLFHDDAPFYFHRKLYNFGASDDLVNVLSKHIIGRFLAMLPNTAPYAKYTVETTVNIQLKIIEEFEEIIKRTAFKLPELTLWDNGSWFIIDQEMKIPRIKYKLTATIKSRAELDYIDSRAYRKAMGEWKDGIEKASDVCKSLLLVVEVMNLVGALKAFPTDGTEIEQSFSFIDIVGSVSDAISAADFLLQKKLIAKYGEKAFKGAFAQINLVGSVCDYIGALKNSYIASSEDKMSLAMAHSVVGLAAGAGVTSSALMLTGGSTATAFGVAATGYGLIAVALAFAGATLVWIFTEEDIEEWAKESEWSKQPSRKLTLATQARNLHEILCRFKVECYILRQVTGSTLTNQGTFASYSNELKLQITPGMLYTNKSRFRVKLNIADDDGLLLNTIFGKEVILDKSIILPDAKTQIIQAKDRKPGAIRRYFGKDELKNQPDFLYDKLVYKCTVHLDLNGDGLDMYPEPDKPMEVKGRVQARMRDPE